MSYGDEDWDDESGVDWDDDPEETLISDENESAEDDLQSEGISTPTDVGFYKENPVADKLPSELISTEATSENTLAVIDDQVSISRSSFEIKQSTVSLDDLVFLKPLRDYRVETYAGLFTSIQEMGILTPVVVTPTENFLDYIEEHDSDEGYLGARYKLLDGFRRVYAAAKLGIETLPAQIVTFNDPEMGAENSVLFSLILNRTQRHDWKELWGIIEVLELQTSMTPATLEWLLALEPGDSMRLKDVMLCEYPEIIENFLSRKKTLLQSYNALQKARKEENLPKMDDRRGVSPIEGTEELIDAPDEGTRLSDAEVQELLEMTGSDEGISDENYGGDVSSEEMFGEASADHVQDTKNRERLSPELRSAILRRDNFTCQVCGFGKGITSSIQLGLLECHHITSVYVGGNDSSENFVTVCDTCHKFIHILAGFNGKIGMSKEEFEAVPESEQTRIRNAVKYARIILAAEEKSGKKLKKYKPERIPFWTSQAEGQQVLKELAKGAK